MRSDRLPLLSYSRKRWLVAALLLAGCRLASGQNTNQQQGVFLKNPTPREPDLEQKYAVNTNSVGTVDHASVVLDSERQMLIAHASKDLATLASTLKVSLEKHAQGSYAAEVQVATLMETLAKNINGALRAGTPDTHLPAAAKQEEEAVEKAALANARAEDARRMRLETASERLVVLTQELQTDVTTINMNTLSTTALTRSAEIEVLAKNLKQHLKKEPRG